MLKSPLYKMEKRQFLIVYILLQIADMSFYVRIGKTAPKQVYINLIVHRKILPLNMHFRIFLYDKNLIHNLQLNKAKTLSKAFSMIWKDIKHFYFWEQSSMVYLKCNAAFSRPEDETLGFRDIYLCFFMTYLSTSVWWKSRCNFLLCWDSLNLLPWIWRLCG